MSRIVAVVALAFSLLPAPALAAEEAQAGPSMEVSIGLGGYTSRSGPSELSATIATPVLISGRLRVRGADISVSRPVEVPAGGDQTYRLLVPALEDGVRLTVELLDQEGERLISDTVTIRRPSHEELAVGVMADEQLLTTLGRVRSVVTDRPVSAVAVTPGISPSAFAVLDYLVVGRSAADAATDVTAWASGGARVVVDASLVDDSAISTPLVESGLGGVRRAPIGGGELVVVEDLDTRSAEDWASILRPTAIDFTGSQEWAPFGNDPRALLQAASESGSRQVPSLPWLLFAILGFALVVGPVNFVVLSRLGKRDWAWVTIPVISLLSVVGFWVAGRQRIAGTNVTHASVIIDEGAPQARSAVLVAAGVAGERSVSFGDGAMVYPERSMFGSGGTELQLDGDGAARLELDQLGFTGIGVASGVGVELPTVSVEGDRLVVDNPSQLSFWGWGATSGGGAAVVAPDELAAGGSGDVAIPRGGAGQFGFGFVDSLMNQRQLWEDPVRSNSLWPFSQVMINEMDPNSVYFVGMTDDFQPDVSVDGASASVAGPTLVMIEVEVEIGEENVGDGVAAAEVVDTGFINWVDWGVERVISTDELTVRFQLPEPTLTVTLRDAQRFGMAPQAYQAWDWESGEFVEVAREESLDPGFISPDGQVYVRLVAANEFGDNPMSPSDLSLVWEA